MKEFYSTLNSKLQEEFRTIRLIIYQFKFDNIVLLNQ